MSKIIRGQTVKIRSVVWADYDAKIPADITGATITTMFKKNPRDLDADALFSKTVGSGVTIIDGPNGVCETLLTKANTLTFSNKVSFETEAILSDGVTSIRSGILTLEVEGNVKKA